MEKTTHGRPIALPVRPHNIPEELKTPDRFVVWRYVEEIDPDTGEIDFDKPPVSARTGRLASSTNPSTWTSYAEALDAYGRESHDGIGFVLHRTKGDTSPGLVAIDLDKCRDPETGAIEAWAKEIIHAVSSYSEVSPSGRGVRIFLFGNLPVHGRKRGRFEVYETGRYVTVTGHYIEGSPRTIEHRQAELEKIHRQVFGEPAPRTPPGRSHTVGHLDDQEIIRRASEARGGAGAKFSRLWRGEISGYASRSEADLALVSYLAFWCGPNEERIADLFGQSGLHRSKWNREDYRRRTIAKALSGRTEFYDPSKNGRTPRNGRPSGHDTEAEPARGAPAADSTAAAEHHLTDLGNARRVLARHGDDLRHCHPWKRWLCWDGRRWADDETAEVVRRVKETQGDLYRETAEAIRRLGDTADGEDRKARLDGPTKLLKHCLGWEEAKKISACIELMKSEPGVPVLPPQLDADPFLFNCLNGTLDLRTGQLRPHRREDNLTKLAPVEFDPNARCPRWEAFLRKVMGGNHNLIHYLQRVVGYCLTGDVSEQCLWFFYGGGQNGKSTFLTTTLDMLGDYGIQAVSELLMVKNTEAHPTERADLFGRRFVATIETEDGKRIAESLMKQMTGGDRMRVRKMRQDYFEFKPQHKIVLAANHKPVVRGTDFAAWRRIKLVPFTVTIPEAEKDRALPEKLRAELPGILAWAVRGCLEWQQHGLGEPEEVRQATAAYQAEMDTIAGFIEECCHAHRDLKVRSSALFDAYVSWSGDKLITPRSFRDRLKAKGFHSDRGHGGGYYWHGTGLQPSQAGAGEGW